MSDLFFFRTLPAAADPSTSWSPSIAFYGDMGNVNARSMVRLQEEAQKGIYDLIFHVGDFAYDMDSVGSTSFNIRSLHLVSLSDFFCS